MVVTKAANLAGAEDGGMSLLSRIERAQSAASYPHCYPYTRAWL